MNWISVKDQEPPKDHCVLAYGRALCDGNYSHSGMKLLEFVYWDDASKGFVFGGDDACPIEVYYWIELPEVPKTLTTDEVGEIIRRLECGEEVEEDDGEDEDVFGMSVEDMIKHIRDLSGVHEELMGRKEKE